MTTHPIRTERTDRPLAAAVPTHTPIAAPTIAGVAARHPELPGLETLLDPEARTGLLGPLLGHEYARRTEITRMRLKPGASLTVGLRVLPSAHVTGEARWWRVCVFAPESWEAKGRKEVRAAHTSGRPALVDEALRVTVVPAETDRHLPLLERLRPDTATLVRLPGRAKHLGPRWLRTLSYNPARRWVGAAYDADLQPRELLRLYGDAEELEVREWTPGRPWRAIDAENPTLVAGLVPALAGGLEDRRAAGELRAERSGVGRQLVGAVTTLDHLDPALARRAQAVADAIEVELAATPEAPGHGDFTPDQVVVDGERPAVLDWDHAGLWPIGWDSACWEAGQVLGGTPPGQVRPLPGTEHLTPAVRAAALIAYAPDPFRRQVPDWGATTAALVAAAEETLL